MKCKVFVDVAIRLVLDAEAGDTEAVYAMLDDMACSIKSQSAAVGIASTEVIKYEVLAAIPEEHPLTSKTRGVDHDEV